MMFTKKEIEEMYCAVPKEHDIHDIITGLLINLHIDENSTRFGKRIDKIIAEYLTDKKHSEILDYLPETIKNKILANSLWG